MEIKKLQKDEVFAFKETLIQTDIENILRKKLSKFWGLIPPKLEINSFIKVYLPYYLAQLKFRYKKHKGTFYIFFNCLNGFKKGVAKIDNIDFENIKLNEHYFFPSLYEESKVKKELVNYAKSDLLIKHFRKFIDWDVNITSFEMIYRPQAVIKYTTSNGQSKNFFIFTDKYKL